MSGLGRRAFVKMNGCGNAIVTLDLRGSGLSVSPAEARAIARSPGLAYDQLMVLHDPRTANTLAFMTIFNNDGSLSAACGNGTRCVAFVLSRETGAATLRLETAAGLLDCVRESEFVFTVDMGPPRLDWREIPLASPAPDTRSVALSGADLPDALRTFSAVNMGNPHAVYFISAAVDFDIHRWGPRVEHDAMFPEKVNVSFATIMSNDHIILRVWERGAGATLACGTAACATLVAAARAGLTARAATVALPGGDLSIEWRESDGHVLMSGPVELEFEGEFDPAIFAGVET